MNARRRHYQTGPGALTTFAVSATLIGSIAFGQDGRPGPMAPVVHGNGDPAAAKDDGRQRDPESQLPSGCDCGRSQRAVPAGGSGRSPRSCALPEHDLALLRESLARDARAVARGEDAQ